MVRRIFPDMFVPVLMATLLVASLLPVQPAYVPLAGTISSCAIFLLFFLNGVRLPRHEVLAGLSNWRLQGAAVAFCFGAMPLIGLAGSMAFAGLVPPLIAIGLLFCGTLPSTVQSATASTSMAGGNVAASVILAAMLNLTGVVLSPVLFALLAHNSDVAISLDTVGRIVAILLVPFILGQFAQRWLRPWVMRNRQIATFMDRTAIAIAVYVAFSAAVIAGIWQQLSAGELGWIALAITLFLLLSFGGAWALGRAMRLPYADRTTLLFSGAQKSIAVGAPLAALLFTGPAAGMVLLPVLIYHLAQLMISAWIAPVLLRRAPSDARPTGN